MCLVAFALGGVRPSGERPSSAGVRRPGEQEDYRLVLAANRDEFHARETAPAGWWDGRQQVFGGRDLRAGGTWLAIHRNGRVAAVTNVREPDPVSGPRSRGALVADFVSGAEPPAEYATRILRQGEEYAGFNLLLIDMRLDEPALLVSNRDARRIVPADGQVHAWSNGTLDAPWPKVVRLQARLGEVLRQPARNLEPELFAALADRTIPDDALLPDTGVGRERERRLAAAMIVAPDSGFGTRASTLIVVRRDGSVQFVERSWAPAGEDLVLAGERRAEFHLAEYVPA